MKSTLIETVVSGRVDHKPAARSVVEGALFELCDDNHFSCSEDCPVFYVNEGDVPVDEITGQCCCFKDGAGMYAFIKKAAEDRGASPKRTRK